MADKSVTIERIGDTGQIVLTLLRGEWPEAEPQGQTDESKEIQALLKNADSLTGIVRTGWITVVLGCLYAWLTLASFDDADLFLPDRTLTMPIIQTEINAVGFFFFGPLVLMAAYYYFQFMLVRLWDDYGRLHELCEPRGGMIDGLPLDKRVAPWFMTILIPKETQGFDWIAKWIGRFLCFYFLPLTVLAVGYRYLRAHDPLLTGAHIAVIALAIVSGYLFSSYQKRAFKKDDHPGKWTHLRHAAAFLGLCVGLAGSAYLLTTREWFPARLLKVASPHAQLFRAELTTKPSGWNELAWLETRNKLEFWEDCMKNPEEKESECLNLLGGLEASDSDMSKSYVPNLLFLEERDKLRRDRDILISTLHGAQLGHVPEAGQVDVSSELVAREGEKKVIPEAYNCNAWTTDLAQRAKDLRFADLREAFLVGANLRCAALRNADLRYADLTGAVLELADLSGADLTGAKIRGANFADAKLAGATLTVSFDEDHGLKVQSLFGANFIDADLAAVKLPDTVLHGSMFIRSNLKETNLDESKLQGSIMSEVEFTSGTILTGVNFTGAALRKINLRTPMSGEHIGPTGPIPLLGSSEQIGMTGTGESGEQSKETASDAAAKAASQAAVEEKSGTDDAGSSTEAAASAGTDSAKQITYDQIEHAFGDKSVHLPFGMERPSHWIEENLSNDEARFFGLWQGWRIACGLTPAASDVQKRWLAQKGYDPIEWTKDEINCPPKIH